MILIGIGVVTLVVILAVGFAAFQAQMPHWGATPAEVAQELPGGELLPAPQVDWTGPRLLLVGAPWWQNAGSAIPIGGSPVSAAQ